MITTGGRLKLAKQKTHPDNIPTYIYPLEESKKNHIKMNFSSNFED